jgi:hypothetical protein
MLTFDQAVFFSDLPDRCGFAPSDEARTGLAFLLEQFAADEGFTRRRGWLSRDGRPTLLSRGAPPSRRA